MEETPAQHKQAETETDAQAEFSGQHQAATEASENLGTDEQLAANANANPNPGEQAETEAEAEPWPETVADAIVSSVSSVRRLALRPVARIARRLVYGFVILVLALFVLLFGTIGLIRLLDAYIPQEVWLTYAILGGVFTLAGFVIWSRRPRGAAS